jgi:serine protease AprX
MDSNGNKLFESLEMILTKVTDDEKIPVLIMARSEKELPELELAAQGLEVTHRYKVVPAMAARATRAQITSLVKQSCVRHIEYDAEVRIQMDGATQWSGVNQARTDFGVTGDRDGNASGYSKNDIVRSVVERQQAQGSFLCMGR